NQVEDFLPARFFASFGPCNSSVNRAGKTKGNHESNDSAKTKNVTILGSIACDGVCVSEYTTSRQWSDCARRNSAEYRFDGQRYRRDAYSRRHDSTKWDVPVPHRPEPTQRNFGTDGCSFAYAGGGA